MFFLVSRMLSGAETLSRNSHRSLSGVEAKRWCFLACPFFKSISFWSLIPIETLIATEIVICSLKQFWATGLKTNSKWFFSCFSNVERSRNIMSWFSSVAERSRSETMVLSRLLVFHSNFFSKIHPYRALDRDWNCHQFTRTVLRDRTKD